MTFSEVDQRYQELQQQSRTGTLTDEEFDETLHALMVQDAEGKWWAKSREKGEWHFYDAISTNWVRAEPPQEGLPAEMAGAMAGEMAGEMAAPTVVAPEPAVQSPADANADANSQLPKWAARAPQPAEIASPVVGTKPDAPSAVRPRQSAASAFGPIPELGTGLKVIFYLLALFIPILGFVLFFIYRNKPAQQDRSAARTFLILGIVSLALSCLCTIAYGALAAWFIAVPAA